MKNNFFGKHMRMLAAVVCATTFLLNAVGLVSASALTGSVGASSDPGLTLNVPWTQGPYGDILVSTSVLSSHLSLDKKVYSVGDSVYASIYLANIPENILSNSITSTFTFDNTVFELATEPLENSVDFRFDYNMSGSTVEGNLTTLKYGFYKVDESVLLPTDEGSWMDIRLKVKQNAGEGYHHFSSELTVIDIQGNVVAGSQYQMTNEVVLVAEKHATITGFISFYFGEEYADLNQLILKNLSHKEINHQVRNIYMNLIGGVTSNYMNNLNNWIQQEKNGDLFHFASDGRVMVQFSIPVSNEGYYWLHINDSKFYPFNIPQYTLGQEVMINAEETPLIIYPGDIAGIAQSPEGTFVKAGYKDGKINASDFSTWYYNFIHDFKGSANNLRLYDPLEADFTRDGKVDNLDFSLWLAASKKTN